MLYTRRVCLLFIRTWDRSCASQSRRRAVSPGTQRPALLAVVLLLTRLSTSTRAQRCRPPPAPHLVVQLYVGSHGDSPMMTFVGCSTVVVKLVTRAFKSGTLMYAHLRRIGPGDAFLTGSHPRRFFCPVHIPETLWMIADLSAG